MSGKNSPPPPPPPPPTFFLFLHYITFAAYLRANKVFENLSQCEMFLLPYLWVFLFFFFFLSLFFFQCVSELLSKTDPLIEFQISCHILTFFLSLPFLFAFIYFFVCVFFSELMTIAHCLLFCLRVHLML